MSQVIVIGGGISGLSSAYFLSKFMPANEITILESTDRLGGVIKPTHFGSKSIETGPDSFITRIPTALQLSEELGISHLLLSPATNAAKIYHRSKLRPIPSGTVFGAPSNLKAFYGNSLISKRGQLRAMMEPLLPQASVPGDTTVGKFAKNRWGKETAQILIDPLVGGIHAGNTLDLSLAKCAPQYLHASKLSRSVSIGLSTPSKSSGISNHPAFYSFETGLDQLVQSVKIWLVEHGVEILTNSGVKNVVSSANGFRIETENDTYDCKKIICATPAYISSEILKNVGPRAAELLGAIEYASPIMTLFSYDRGAFRDYPDGSGVLVPRSNNMLTTAITFASNKWPHWSSENEVLFRVSSGKFGDNRAWELSDEALVANLEVELAKIIGTLEKSIRSQVHRWRRSLPQFRPFHEQLISKINQSLPTNLELAGSAYKGVGIPACIASAQDAVHRLLN